MKKLIIVFNQNKFINLILKDHFQISFLQIKYNHIFTKNNNFYIVHLTTIYFIDNVAYHIYKIQKKLWCCL